MGQMASVGKKMDAYDLNFDADAIFEIHSPLISDWQESELYDFRWNNIKTLTQPFGQFNFYLFGNVTKLSKQMMI